MTPEPLPQFRYHPAPLDTGSIKPSENACECCGRARGHVYDAPVYSTDEVEVLCPWCIADGTAARRFDAQFTDVDASGIENVADATIREITERTPGFRGWQQEHWMFHCDDGAAFLGLAGAAELERVPEAVAMLLHENDQFGWTPDESAAYVAGLHVEGDATAYLFRCLVCGTHLAYSDMA
jgi:uncharacterized protein CbrC (UPF0167 family)